MRRQHNKAPKAKPAAASVPGSSILSWAGAAGSSRRHLGHLQQVWSFMRLLNPPVSSARRGTTSAEVRNHPPSPQVHRQRGWSSRRQGAAPHHHPSTEPRGSAGAGAEPPPLHKASLQTGSALEPRHFPRGNSGRSMLPSKTTAALLPAGPPPCHPVQLLQGFAFCSPRPAPTARGSWLLP